MQRIPRITFGIRALDAAYDELVTAVEWSRNIRGEHPVTVADTPTGPVVSYVPPLRKKVKLTSAGTTSGSYNASEVYEAASGTWTVYPSGWTGVVWEYNLHSGITLPAYATAEWCHATSDWRFQLGGC